MTDRPISPRQEVLLDPADAVLAGHRAAQRPPGVQDAAERVTLGRRQLRRVGAS